MTTLAPSTDRIVTFDVPDFPGIDRIITVVVGKLRRSGRAEGQTKETGARDLTTMPGVRANGRDWLMQALDRLQSVASLPPGWDGEGSPPPTAQIVESAVGFLQYLQRDDVPLPFICPISGGGLQLEWSTDGKEIEIEFLNQQTIAFMRVDNGRTTDSGEYPVTDINKSRKLLDWLAGA